MIMTGDDRREPDALPPKTPAAAGGRRKSTPRVTASRDPFTDPLADPLADPWADWKPQWQALRKQSKKGKRKPPASKAGSKTGAAPATPHDFQERHSPTEGVTTRLTPDRRQERGQRRIVDARLWEAMSAPQQSAALEISRAFETMGKGLGYVTSDWERIPGCAGPNDAAEAHMRRVDTYVEWTKRCHREKVSHSMVIDVLVFGFSCRALDRDRRVRPGAARDNLLAGLSIYCALRGWPER
ncbi:MAG: hypothetical protein GC185_04530 [Alphaproteobacteria bacterium]|nr:hypothetical protein [Alphaproteobacteria bacterium]